jgi:hypothetical protein
MQNNLDPIDGARIERTLLRSVLYVGSAHISEFLQPPQKRSSGNFRFAGYSGLTVQFQEADSPLQIRVSQARQSVRFKILYRSE